VTRALEIDVIRATPPELSTCRDPDCRARIEWVRTAYKGRRMPITHPLVVLRVHERLDGQVISVIASEQSHFSSCVAAKRFRRGR
jgi:hypothetical protein